MATGGNKTCRNKPFSDKLFKPITIKILTYRVGDARKRIFRRGIKPISAFFAEGRIEAWRGVEGEAAFPEAERSGVNRLFIGVNMMFLGVNMMFIGVNRFFIGVNSFL